MSAQDNKGFARFQTSADTDATVLTFADGATQPIVRPLASEVAVQVLYGGLPFAVMMMSPADLEDFAFGFSLTEGVIEQADDIREILVTEGVDHVRVAIDLVPSRLQAHLARRRTMAGRSGCGLCGIEDAASLRRNLPRPGAGPHVHLSALSRALQSLDAHQKLNRVTRAVHAAAWADTAGNVVCVREDVGRHNALDKLIGALMQASCDASHGFVLVTSRCSFEMVEKAASFGAAILVAVSAPTAFAIERARSLDITIAAIARRDSVTVFYGLERIVVV